MSRITIKDSNMAKELMYCPEMGEAKPQAEIEARLGHYGNHYYLTTAIELSGRGVRFIETNTAENCTPDASIIGKHRYCVTIRAYERICKTHTVSYSLLL